MKEIKEKAKYLKEKFGDLAVDVVNEITDGLESMYIYDNSEAFETREDELKWWMKVIKEIKNK